ncbi:MAG: phosphosulfolactate synthase [Bacteroidota bacterium]|nr:phosphosulfolactate synthase [Bacteroidota bacterium]
MKQTDDEVVMKRRFHTGEYLRELGIPKIPPLASPVDTGYDTMTFESHLDQSSHLISIVKIGLGGWLVADENATRQKVAAARRYNIPTVTGGSSLEIAFSLRKLPSYLDLCADIGVTRVEVMSPITGAQQKPKTILSAARERDLEVQVELWKQASGISGKKAADSMIDQGQEWLNAGAIQLIVKARESLWHSGLFNRRGMLNYPYAERFAKIFGLHTVMFEAPDLHSQFTLLDYFGRDVHLCNIRLEDLLQAESYRRGLHFEAFQKLHLRPQAARQLSQRELFEATKV